MAPTGARLALPHPELVEGRTAAQHRIVGSL